MEFQKFRVVYSSVLKLHLKLLVVQHREKRERELWLEREVIFPVDFQYVRRGEEESHQARVNRGTFFLPLKMLFKSISSRVDLAIESWRYKNL